MSKSQVKGGKSTKDVLTKVKSGGVSKPVNGAKDKSKDLAQKVAKKEQKVKKAVKPPTPSESEASSSEDSGSESDSEVEIKKPVVNGKTNGVKSAVKEVSESESESESESQSESDSEDDSEDDSESEDEAPKTNGVKVKPAARDDSDDSDESSDESDSEAEKPSVSAVMGAKVTQEDSDSEESDSEDEKPAAKQAPKTNGLAKDDSEDDSEDISDDSESDDDSEAPAAKPAPKINGAAKATKDDSDDSSDSDSSDESEEEEKPKTTKRKADDLPERATKKAKAEAESANGPNLFVGNLSWNITEEWLREEFEGFGELSGVRLMTDRATGRSKGFGYVEFVSAADAAKAHAAKKEHELDGRPMNVDFANQKPTDGQRQANRSQAYGDSQNAPSDTLFVGNLPFSADADSVTQAFEPHGSITGIRLPTEQETGRPRGFGYVTFSSIDEAKAALEAMSGYYLDGRPIRLDYSQPRDNKGGDDSPRGGFGGRGRGRGGFGDRGGRGGRGGFNDRGGRGGGRGRGAPRGGRGGSTNRGGFGDFSGRKTTF